MECFCLAIKQCIMIKQLKQVEINQLCDLLCGIAVSSAVCSSSLVNQRTLAAKAGSLSTFCPTEIILQQFAFLVSLQQYNLSVRPIKSTTPLLHSPQARLEQQQKRSATLLTNQPTR
ncbi:putative serum albumin [Trichinella spiralis]|uniref:putative serum albumin n=1 Tax=Trichinella spiralis TaxID=6334 RepID=UPI0001EFE719|nr:putative serum albumin [Trichinella spiralis]